jgi:hypothetical protein
MVITLCVTVDGMEWDGDICLPWLCDDTCTLPCREFGLGFGMYLCLVCFLGASRNVLLLIPGRQTLRTIGFQSEVVSNRP